MSKDRGCASQYPMYPMYGNMPGPIMAGGVNMPMPLPFPEPTMNTNMPYSNSEINTLNNKVNSLEQRVTNLENMINKTYSSGYNTSNYQIM